MSEITLKEIIVRIKVKKELTDKELDELSDELWDLDMIVKDLVEDEIRRRGLAEKLEVEE